MKGGVRRRLAIIVTLGIGASAVENVDVQGQFLNLGKGVLRVW